MAITSDEVNFLVYRYLQESGKFRAVKERRLNDRDSPTLALGW